ncbi:MAG: hypothetical protein WCY86_04690 [Spirosomataceae bacterium]
MRTTGSDLYLYRINMTGQPNKCGGARGTLNERQYNVYIKFFSLLFRKTKVKADGD